MSTAAWRPWDGYAGPAPRDTLVDLQLANGTVTTGVPADSWYWEHSPNEPTNIVAWRPSGGPMYSKSFGYALATRVLLSPMYAQLHEDERAECDALIARGMI